MVSVMRAANDVSAIFHYEDFNLRPVPRDSDLEYSEILWYLDAE